MAVNDARQLAADWLSLYGLFGVERLRQELPGTDDDAKLAAVLRVLAELLEYIEDRESDAMDRNLYL